MAVVTRTNEGRQNVDAVCSHIITHIFTATHLLSHFITIHFVMNGRVAE